MIVQKAYSGMGERRSERRQIQQSQYVKKQQKGKEWVYRVKEQIPKVRKGVYRVKEPSPKFHQPQPSQDNPDGVFRGVGKSSILYSTNRKCIQPSGNGWLLRSAVAKINKLVSSKDLKDIFKREGVAIDSIKPMGGRFVIITFPNPEARDEYIKKDWMST